jgi:hypothetical protein
MYVGEQYVLNQPCANLGACHWERLAAGRSVYTCFSSFWNEAVVFGGLLLPGLYIDLDQLWDEGTPELTLVAILESSLLFKAGMGDLTIYLFLVHPTTSGHQIIVKQYGWVGYFSTNHVELMACRWGEIGLGAVCLRPFNMFSFEREWTPHYGNQPPTPMT